MINLIGQKQIINLKKEYRNRLIILIIWLLILLGLFILAYTVPYYLSVINNDIVVSKQLESVIAIENKENLGPSLNQIIGRANDELRAVDLMEKRKVQASTGLSLILNNKTGGIKINHFSFKGLGLDQSQFIINGTADSRQALVKFIADLKTVETFAVVESPISDFAKNTLIPFTVNLKTKQ